MGPVISLNRDAVTNPKQGAIQIARIQLARDTIRADNKVFHLSHGLGVTADVRTGSGPIMTTVEQAAREK